MWHVMLPGFGLISLSDGSRTTLFLLPGAELLVIFNFVSVIQEYSRQGVCSRVHDHETAIFTMASRVNCDDGDNGNSVPHVPLWDTVRRD